MLSTVRRINSTSFSSTNGAVVRYPPANAGDARDVDSIPGWERAPGGGNGNPLHPTLFERLIRFPREDSSYHLKVKVTQSCPTLFNPMDYTVHGILQARILEWVPFPSPGDLPNPEIKPRSPTLRVDSLPAEPPGKPKNTRVNSLSLLQLIFPPQELNWDLLHCRKIPYQLSYQGSPSYHMTRV